MVESQGDWTKTSLPASDPSVDPNSLVFLPSLQSGELGALGQMALIFFKCCITADCYSLTVLESGSVLMCARPPEALQYALCSLPFQLAGAGSLGWHATSGLSGRWLTAAQKRIVGRNRGEGSGSLEIGPAMPGIVELGPTTEERLMGEMGRALGWQSGCIHFWVCNGLL